jgi:hypothetical protein
MSWPTRVTCPRRLPVSNIVWLRRILIRERTAVLGDFAQLEVYRLDRVGGVDDLGQLDRIVQERHEFRPGIAPHIDRTRILLTELLVELFEREFGSVDSGSAVDRAHG